MVGTEVTSYVQPQWDNPSTPVVTPAPRGHLWSTSVATCQMFLPQLPECVVRMRSMIQVQEGASGNRQTFEVILKVLGKGLGVGGGIFHLSKVLKF